MDMSISGLGNDERPGIEESYTSAVATSNLRVHVARRTDADVVIAAGMSPSRLGSALLRLHSEWDRTAKPSRLTPRRIEELAKTLAKHATKGLVESRTVVHVDGRPQNKIEMVSPLVAAVREADRWYMQELGLQFQQLKTLPFVRDELVRHFQAQAMVGWKVPAPFPWGKVDQVPHAVAAILQWWLDSTCRTCDGVKWKVVPGTSRTNGRACEACKGYGRASRPYHALGALILGHMNTCMTSARGDIGRKFRHQHRLPSQQG